MAGENETNVRITATSEVAAGVEQAKGSIQGLSGFIAEVRAGFANMGAQIDELKSQFASFGSTAAGAMTEAKVATEGESGALTGMVLKVHEAAEGIRTMQARAREFAEVYASIFLVDQVKEFVASMAEAAEKVDHLSQRLGMTTGQVQALQGVAAGTGMSIDTLVKGLQMLDNRAVTAAGATSSAAKAFQFLGISANDGRSNMERLLLAADKFKSLPDGPDKAALAMQAFGRAGAELIPILDKGSDGIQALIDKAKEYGLVNDDAEAKGMKLAEAVNESNIAWQGLKTTLMDALAPSLTSIVEGFDAMVARMTTSYETGGAVKQAFDGIVAAGRSIGSVLSGIAPLFEALATHIKEVTTALEALALVMIGRYVAGAVAASVASGALSTILFAVTAAAGGAATALEALALVAATAGRALLAAFGGPVGIAIAAVTLAVYELIGANNKVVEATGDYKAAMAQADDISKQATDDIEKLATAQGKDREAAEAAARAHLRAADAKLKDAQATLTQLQAEQAHSQITLERDAAKPGAQARTLAGAALSVATHAPIDLDHTGLFRTNVGDDQDYLAQLKANAGAAQKTIDSLADTIKRTQTALAAPAPSFAGPDLTATHKGKEKKEKDTVVQQLEDELTDKKMVWDAEQDAQNTAQAYSLESEKAFWANALATVAMSAKDRGEVERKYLEVSKQLREQQISEQIATYRDDEAEAGRNADAKLQIVKQEVAFIGRMRGEQSTQYKDALRREVEAERAAAEQKRQIAQQLADEMRRLQDLRIAQEEADARFLVEMGLKTQGQLLADERNFENQRYAAAAADAQRRKAIIDPNRDPVAYAKANAEIETLERQHQNALTQIDQKAVLQRTTIERQAINQLSSSWGQAIGKMVTLQASFASTIKSLWQGIQQAVGNAIASIIEQWLTKHLSALLVGGAASKTSAVAEIGNQAAVAGASGTASYAAAPWPIDMGAPAFGASMAAAAAGFGSLISAEGGAWTVPGGPAILHPDEMVLPAWAASPLRDMITGRRPANVNAPAAANQNGSGGGGGTHLHLHGDIIHNPAQLEAWFKKNAPAVGAGVRQYVRNGGSTSR